MGASLYPPPVAPDPTPTTTTSGLVAADSFGVNSFYGSKVNGVCMVHVYVVFNGWDDPAVSGTANPLAPTSGTGNLADTMIATLPSGYRPPTTINFVWGDGGEDGEGYINTSGGVYIRTVTYNQPITVGKNLRVTATFTL